MLLRVCTKVEFGNAGIETAQMNDARETLQIRRYGKKVRITGLDTLFLQDYENAFTHLLSYSKDIELCPGNAYGCASALALEYVHCGGKRIAVSFMGLGGFAPLEEVLLALYVTHSGNQSVDLRVLAELRTAYEENGAGKVSTRNPVIGEKIFHVESGIHVNGILKNAANYEPFSPETVGLLRKIVLGKHSGRSAIEYKLRELDLSDGKFDTAVLLKRVRDKSEELSCGLSDSEFIEICDSLKAT
jgi:homocitrate synthase NifV